MLPSTGGWLELRSRGGGGVRGVTCTFPSEAQCSSASPAPAESPPPASAPSPSSPSSSPSPPAHHHVTRQGRKRSRRRRGRKIRRKIIEGGGGGVGGRRGAGGAAGFTWRSRPPHLSVKLSSLLLQLGQSQSQLGAALQLLLPEGLGVLGRVGQQALLLDLEQEQEQQQKNQQGKQRSQKNPGQQRHC